MMSFICFIYTRPPLLLLAKQSAQEQPRLLVAALSGSRTPTSSTARALYGRRTTTARRGGLYWLAVATVATSDYY